MKNFICRAPCRRLLVQSQVLSSCKCLRGSTQECESYLGFVPITLTFTKIFGKQVVFTCDVPAVTYLLSKKYARCFVWYIWGADSFN